MHYERLRFKGTTDALVRPSFMERVASKIEVTDAGCWEWTAYRNHSGYGQIGRGRRVALAHRAVYEELVGPIEEGLQLDHLCRNTRCCNPSHLEPVTPRENTRRSDKTNLGANMRARTHCPAGHIYDVRNTRLYRGSRHCRACARERQRARKARAAA
jgi:hypothetical protein